MNVVDHLVTIFGSQEALAKIAGASQSSVADWKKGNRIPYPRMQAILQNASDRVTPADFFPTSQPEKAVS